MLNAISCFQVVPLRASNQIASPSPRAEHRSKFNIQQIHVYYTKLCNLIVLERLVWRDVYVKTCKLLFFFFSFSVVDNNLFIMLQSKANI
jgi:hypothetical protein